MRIILRLSNVPLEGNDDEDAMTIAMTAAANSDLKLKRSISNAGETLPALTANNAVAPPTPEVSSTLASQRAAAVYLRPFFTLDSLVTKCLEHASKDFEHIMDFTRLRALGSMFTMINQSVRNVLIYNREHDFDLNEEIFEKYITKSLILAILWSFSGD